MIVTNTNYKPRAQLITRKFYDKTATFRTLARLFVLKFCDRGAVVAGWWQGERTLQKQKPIEGFDIEAYKRRLRILREIVSGENQQEFAERLGIDMKRWNNYERGYPVPREIAFLLKEKIPGLDPTWLWWGWTGNMADHLLKRIHALEEAEREQRKAEQALAKAADRLKDAAAKRKRVRQPPSSSSR